MIHPSIAALNSDQCQFLAAQALQYSGVNVNPAKRDFIHHRVSKRLTALGLSTFEEYIQILRADADGSETHHLVESLTTHTTSFFRESHQYEWLEKTGLADLCENRIDSTGPLTVWSAACSTGVELWSAGMLLMDAAQRDRRLQKFSLLGSDISRRILRVAQNATYSESEIKGVSEQYQKKYLMQSRKRHGSGNHYYFRIVPELRERARFVRCNLSKPDEGSHFSADIVFLRNVLIYFEAATQGQVLDHVISRIRPGGFLFTGHSETVPQRPDLIVLGPSTYQKV